MATGPIDDEAGLVMGGATHPVLQPIPPTESRLPASYDIGNIVEYILLTGPDSCLSWMDVANLFQQGCNGKGFIVWITEQSYMTNELSIQ